MSDTKKKFRDNKYKQLRIIAEIERLKQQTVQIDTTAEQSEVDRCKRMLEISLPTYLNEIKMLEAKLVAAKEKLNYKQNYWNGQITEATNKLNNKLNIHNFKIEEKERNLRQVREERLEMRNTSITDTEGEPLTKEQTEAILTGKDILPPDPSKEKLAFYKALKAKQESGDIEWKEACKIVMKKYGEEEDYDAYCQENGLITYD